jgi:histidine triad (HIT) family protein
MYNHAPDGYACPFCLLLNGIANEHVASVQTDIVYRDDEVTAFIGAHQWAGNLGNVIVVPNEHFENLYDLPVCYAVPVHRLVRQIALALKALYSCDGVSTRQHNEPAGNQDVWHYHVHITPRYVGDGFCTSRRELMPAIQRGFHAERLRSFLRGQQANGAKASF